jgi:protein subunit release factor A
MSSILNYNNNFVSLFHSLGNETVKQDINIRNNIRNNNETLSLKELALKALERNKLRNKTETNEEKFVSHSEFSETEIQKIKLELQEIFDERAAIMEYDRGIPRDEAEIFASHEARMYLEKKNPIVHESLACLTVIQQN